MIVKLFDKWMDTESQVLNLFETINHVYPVNATIFKRLITEQKQINSILYSFSSELTEEPIHSTQDLTQYPMFLKHEELDQCIENLVKQISRTPEKFPFHFGYHMAYVIRKENITGQYLKWTSKILSATDIYNMLKRDIEEVVFDSQKTTTRLEHIIKQEKDRKMDLPEKFCQYMRQNTFCAGIHAHMKA